MIVFPDPVTKTRQYLLKHFPGVHVSGEVPKKPPAKMITIAHTGGSRENVAQESSILAVQVWAGDNVAASRLARKVCAALRAWADDPYGPITTVSTPYEFPDPDTNKARYQMTFIAVFRPEEE